MSGVAIVELNRDVQEAFMRALELIGGIDDLNTEKRNVVIKVGVFDHRGEMHSTVDVVNAIAKGFNKAPKVFLAESDNYRGAALQRLQIWKELFSERVLPFSLSDDKETIEANVAGEKINLSHMLFKPNVMVSTHILRVYEKGSIIKNLLGITPTSKKAKFHKNLETVLLDLYEAVGGIDLAVLDGTYMDSGVASSKARNRIKMDIIIVGRDAVAVEAVGAEIVGMNPEKMPLIQEAVKRGLGEGDLEKIEVVGCSLESMKEKLASLLPQKRKGRKASLQK
jgi:uncharacterized protein (DUF362 family)